MTISKSGLFVAYRNVVLKEEGSAISQELAMGITKAYSKIKFKKKKNPSNYVLIKLYDKFKAVTVREHGDEDHFGNLQDLYLDLSKDIAPIYTDDYSKSFTIKIGTPVVMDRSKCNPNQDQTCSTGLHVAGKQWLEDQGSYFGNTPLKVLVNPTDVVCVPPLDSYGKMRTCAYYPIELLEKDSNGVLIEEKSFDGFEDDFINIITYTGNVNNEDDGNYKLDIPSCPELNKSNIYDRLEEIRNNETFKQVNHYEDEYEDEDEDEGDDYDYDYEYDDEEDDDFWD
jgi:hypothetical protein